VFAVNENSNIWIATLTASAHSDLLDYTLIRSAKRRTVAIQLYHDRLVVRAPTRASLHDIESFIRDKAPWIIKQRKRLMSTPKPAALTYQTGETHLYLGKAYPLKLFMGGAHAVRLMRNAIHITSPTRATSSQIKAKLDRWYHACSQAYFPTLVDKWHKHPYFQGKPLPTLSIRRMRSRWGSLTKQGHMTLNSQLIKAHEDCIDYVVLHEFCHLIHFNHSPAFHQLMSELMPDWKYRKQALKQVLLHTMAVD